MRKIGSHWAKLTPAQRKYYGTVTAEKAKQTKLARYGPTMRKRQPHSDWLRAHGKPLPSEANPEALTNLPPVAPVLRSDSKPG